VDALHAGEGMTGGWKRKGRGPAQYCLEVENNHNFIVNDHVVSNCKFEQKWFWWHYRLKLWPIFCTFRASALIHNGIKGIAHDLDSVVRRDLSENPTHVGQGGSNWAGVLTQEQKDYAAEDVLRLPRLYKALREQLATYGLLQTALIEFGVILAEARTELNGFPIDAKRWTALAEANEQERSRLKEELLADLPSPTGQIPLLGMSCGWNLDSPQQVLKSLHRLGLKLDSTEEIALAPYAAKHAVIRKFLKYRHVAQLVKTYGVNYLRHVCSQTGRLHSEYYSMLKTGRYASSKPNLQQVPREKEFRDCFELPFFKRFVLADYAGIEMRICAEVSGDLELIGVFTRGEDVHAVTASALTGVPVSEISPLQRQSAKPTNFGLIYGMMPEKLVLYSLANYGVVMTLKEAAGYRDRFFEKYSGIAIWHKKALREGARDGFSRNLGGRLRYMDPDEVYNEFLNSPVQSVGADGLKISLCLVQGQLDKVFGVSSFEKPDAPVGIVHHVHDEIILETADDSDMITTAQQVLQEGMHAGMSKFLKRVPVVVDPSFGRTWASAKS